MSIELFNEPYKHIIGNVDTITTFCEEVYPLLLQDPQRTEKFFVNNQEQHNGSVYFDYHSSPLSVEVQLFVQDAKEKYFPELSDDGYWSIHICESNLRPGAPTLDPHTDDPDFIRKEMNDPKHKCGFLKFLIYICDDKLQWTDYGTKVYTSAGEDKNGCQTWDFKKEVEFKNGNIFMWKTGPDSWHGTDFKETPHRRFFVVGEYIL